MKKAGIVTLGIVALLVGGLVTFSNNAYAYQGDPTVHGPNYTPEREALMEKAFANNDYNAWKNLMQNRGRVTQVINQNNFAKFAEAQRLAKEGKLQEAKKIRAELGLGLQTGKGNHSGRYAR